MYPLIFLLKLAWDCRYRLPLLITVGFMVLDIRMQLDINIHTRAVQEGRLLSPPIDNGALDADGASDASWSTFEEQLEEE